MKWPKWPQVANVSMSHDWLLKTSRPERTDEGYRLTGKPHSLQDEPNQEILDDFVKTLLPPGPPSIMDELSRG